ncbi:hypothetical protein PIB30_020464 [Stylosanthes scabra]|uniref:Uncharacterized protein n=1 Tax=Stylosanthes scabra TaxID=79078 RepID=A0ABU6VAW7_9FABA|nr:hypothetical protein [Stylosanthes scabra]
MAENPDSNQDITVTEVVQIPRELPDIYRWVSSDVLGSPCTVDQDYLDELKSSGVIFGGGELERCYQVEVAHRGERVCFINLNHPQVPCKTPFFRNAFLSRRSNTHISQEQLKNTLSVHPNSKNTITTIPPNHHHSHHHSSHLNPLVIFSSSSTSFSSTSSKVMKLTFISLETVAIMGSMAHVFLVFKIKMIAFERPKITVECKLE